MAKKNFKASAKQSVASAFFSEPVKNTQDTKDTEDMYNAEIVLTNENTQNKTKAIKDIRNIQTVSTKNASLDTQNRVDTEEYQNSDLQQKSDGMQIHPKTLELPPYRINLKLKGEYKEYLDQVSWENRMSITQYLNELIAKDQQDYQAKKK